VTWAVKDIEQILREHPFFQGLEPRFFQLICGCAANAHFGRGDYLFHEADPADRFFLIRQGRVTLETRAPGRTQIVQTLREGEIAGVSWLIPPYRWSFDAKALEDVRAIGVDAACLRAKSEADHDLGYALMKRCVSVLAERLQATRLQMLDVYGEHA
jgi:CRP-like cAMP-binding protein